MPHKLFCSCEGSKKFLLQDFHTKHKPTNCLRSRISTFSPSTDLTSFEKTDLFKTEG